MYRLNKTISLNRGTTASLKLLKATKRSATFEIGCTYMGTNWNYIA